MNPSLNGSSVLQRFEPGKAVKNATEECSISTRDCHIYIYTFHFEAKNLHGVAELGYCPKVTQDKDVVTGYLLGLDYLIKTKSS